MKKILLSLGFILLLCGSATAQNAKWPTITVSSDPTGQGCASTAVALRTPSGAIYSCVNGAYAIVGGGGGGSCSNLFGNVTGPCNNNVVSAVTTQTTGDATTKPASDQFVAAALSSVNSAVAVEAATTTVLPNTPTYNNGTAGVGATLTAGSAGVLTIDTYTPALNEPVLVKNQASTFQNGVYTLTTVGTVSVPYVLTRRVDYNTVANINYTGTIPVICQNGTSPCTDGSTNGGTGWNLTNQISAVGTSALTYTQAYASSNPGPSGNVRKGSGNLGLNQVIVGQGGNTITADPYTIPATIAAHQTLVATSATAVAAKTIPDCTDTAGNHLNYTQSGDTFSCGTSAPLATVTITTGTTATLSTDYTFNQNATAGAAVAYTLPTASAGNQKCVANSYNGSAADTGVLTVNTSASGQFVIFTDGTLSASGGNVTSGGAAADAACFVGLDTTHWQQYTQSGTWTKH